MEKKKKKRKKGGKKKNGVFSGHYVIASSLPPERLRPSDDCWNAAHGCIKLQLNATGGRGKKIRVHGEKN